MGGTWERRKIYFWLFAMYPEEGLLKVLSTEIFLYRSILRSLKSLRFFLLSFYFAPSTASHRERHQTSRVTSQMVEEKNKPAE